MKISNLFRACKVWAKQIATGIYDECLCAEARVIGDEIWQTVMESKGPRHKTIHVSTVNFCNAKCVFCGQHRFKWEFGTMSDDTFNQLLIGARSMGIQDIDFTPPLGDPLLDKDLFKRAIQARMAGMKSVQMTTNGILFSDAKIAAKTGVLFDEIRISMGGLDRASYRSAYGYDRFDDVWEGIENLSRYKSAKSRILIFMRSQRTPMELMSHPLWSELVAIPNLTVEFTNLYDNWGGSVRPEYLSGAMKPRKLLKKPKVPCIGLWQFFVEWDGSVRLCGCRFYEKEQDDLKIGNVNEEKLGEILSYDRIKKVMDKFDGDHQCLPDVCKNCTLYRPMTSRWARTHGL